MSPRIYDCFPDLFCWCTKFDWFPLLLLRSTKAIKRSRTSPVDPLELLAPSARALPATGATAPTAPIVEQFGPDSVLELVGARSPVLAWPRSTPTQRSPESGRGRKQSPHNWNSSARWCEQTGWNGWRELGCWRKRRSCAEAPRRRSLRFGTAEFFPKCFAGSQLHL